MKKIVCIAIVAIFYCRSVKAQETTYGVTGGINNLISKSTFDTNVLSTTESGFFVGFFVDFSYGYFWAFQSQVNYTSVFFDGKTVNQFIIPLLIKFYSTEKLYLKGGLQLDYFLGRDTIIDDINKFGIGLTAGAGYDINEKVFVFARYSLGLNNKKSSNGDEESSANLASRFTNNHFQVGIGYRF